MHLLVYVRRWPSPPRQARRWHRQLPEPMGFDICKMASGIRSVNCVVPEETSELAPNSTRQGLVWGVRRRFAR
eukprot:1949815-Alexandrium_andersonii.AAC.1